MTVPLLLGGLLLGFVVGYFLLLWGLLVVALVVLAVISAVVAGRSRDAAGALLLGTLAGYGGVLLLALFRGAL